MTNLHSDKGPHYELLSSGISYNAKFSGKLVKSANTRRHGRVIDRFLNWKLLRIGFLPIPFTKKGVKDGLGYHIGGSLPMGGVGKLATDSLGRLKGSSLVYFVDTSTLPSIPATTIGFLTTANAFRIASAALIQD
jgi:choline dehydrogenase-like flavoprotein